MQGLVGVTRAAASLRSRFLCLHQQGFGRVVRTPSSSKSSSSSKNSKGSGTVGDKQIYYGNGVGVCLFGSPLAFTDWQPQQPKSELLFLSGQAIGSLTERMFENEAGQSLFMIALFLAYFGLLGFEGKVNGALMRLKYTVGTNWQLPVHRNYFHALPPNPLLQQARRQAAAAAGKKSSSA